MATVAPHQAKVGDKISQADLVKLLQDPNRPREENGEQVLAQETAAEKEDTDKGPTKEDLQRQRNYRYPLSLSESFPATIIFKVIKIDGVDHFETAGIKKIYNQAKEVLGFADKESESVADQNVDQDTKAKIVADSNEKPKELVSYENNTGGEEMGRITLPLQNRLSYSDVANYDPNATVGILGGLGEDLALGRNPFEGANQGGSLTTAAGALAAQALAKVAAAGVGFGAGAAASKLGGGIVGGLVGGSLGEGLGTAAQSATRVATAPNYRTMFQNVSIRAPFVFDFKLVPSSSEEMYEIKNIVKMFREELYPEKITAGASGVPIAYKFPNLFEIEVRNRFGSNPGFKIQRCYLREVQTTFNENFGMMADGNFNSVTLSLSFVEIVALDKQKVSDGGY